MSSSEKVLRRIERQSEREFLPIIGPEKGSVLIKVIRDINPERILEVGTLVGYSAILMAKELRKDACLITIEIHADEAKIALDNIKEAAVLPNVEVLVGDARGIIPELQWSFDMVFIDAEKTQYIEYLRLIEEKLHKGSVVVADNAGIFADQMRGYLNYVRQSKKYNSRYIAFGEDGVEVSVKL